MISPRNKQLLRQCSHKKQDKLKKVKSTVFIVHTHRLKEEEAAKQRQSRIKTKRTSVPKIPDI